MMIAYNIFIGTCILTLLSWLIAPRVIRDIAAKKERFNSISDFDTIVDRWLGIINNSQTLADTRSKSIPEMERIMGGIRKHLADASKDRLTKEWQGYQDIPRYQLEGKQMRHPETRSTIISYDDARKALSDPLIKMKEIIREA